MTKPPRPRAARKQAEERSAEWHAGFAAAMIACNVYVVPGLLGPRAEYSRPAMDTAGRFIVAAIDARLRELKAEEQAERRARRRRP